jgi:hypothetical protein
MAASSNSKSMSPCTCGRKRINERMPPTPCRRSLFRGMLGTQMKREPCDLCHSPDAPCSFAPAATSAPRAHSGTPSPLQPDMEGLRLRPYGCPGCIRMPPIKIVEHAQGLKHRIACTEAALALSGERAMIQGSGDRGLPLRATAPPASSAPAAPAQFHAGGAAGRPSPGSGFRDGRAALKSPESLCGMEESRMWGEGE